MLSSLDERAVAVGILLAVAGVVASGVLASRRAWTWAWAELCLVAALVMAWILALHLPSVRGLWAEALLVPEAGLLLGLVVLAALAEGSLPARAHPLVALVGGALLGALPTMAVVVPAARDPRLGLRLALVATASGALSPLGGPAPLILGGASVLHSLYALPAVALVLVLVWPIRGVEGERPQLPRWAWALVLGAVLAWVQPLVGLCVAVLGSLALGARPGARGWRWLRWGVAAWLLVGLAHLAGTAWFVGRGLGWLAGHDPSAPLLAASGALAGSLFEPHLVALLGSRSVDLATGPDLSRALVLGLALSPGPAVILTTWRLSGRALPLGLGLGAVVVAVAAGWGALYS